MSEEMERVNSERAIAIAVPVAEKWRPALTAALKYSGEEWRSVDLQVAFLVGEIAWAIDEDGRK